MSISDDNTVCVWSAENGKLLRILEHTDKANKKLSVSPDGKWLLLLCVDLIKIFDINTGLCIRDIQMHLNTESTQLAIFSPTGLEIITASYAIKANIIKVRFWDTSTGVCLRCVDMDTQDISLIKNYPDNKLLFCSYNAIYLMNYSELNTIVITQSKRFQKRVLTSEERKLYYLE